MIALAAFVMLVVLYVIVLRLAMILDDIIEGRDIEEAVENEMDKLRDEFAKIREENKDDEIDRYVRQILGEFDEKEEGNGENRENGENGDLQ